MNLRSLLFSPLAALFAGGAGGSKAAIVALRENWGRENQRKRNMDSIALYHRFSSQDGRIVDEQTWQDLCLDEVFAKLDRTSSKPGRQVLYRQLRTYADSQETLNERTRQQQVFRQDAALREQIQLLLSHLEKGEAEYLAPLLLCPVPKPPRFAWACYLLGAAPTVCLLGMIVAPKLLLAAILFVVVNVIIYTSFGTRMTPYFGGFSQICSLLGVAEKLSKVSDRHELPQIRFLRDEIPAIQRIRKSLGWLAFDRSSMNEIAQAIFAYLNMFFLCDVLVFLRSLSLLEKNQQKLTAIMEAVGSLDASISIASYVEGLSYYSVPKIVDAREFSAVGLFHPLIPHPVGNSFNLAERSAVITGPNMAGKTCFLRTVGINLILAQTVNLCLAREAIIPRAIVKSAIRREDKPMEGDSYFYSEIKQVLEFIRVDRNHPLHFFLIDEIFRGTNTVERIASSVAVLRHLAQEQLVLVTTHDAELQGLLADTFVMHHFSDHIVDGKYGFDYMIRLGASRSRNAIKLLELSGYPKSVISEAEVLAAKLARN